MANSAYLKLAKVLECGLREFSKYPLTICDPVTDNPGEAALSKLRFLEKSHYDYTVFLDADTVPSKAIDDLILNCLELDSDAPVLQRHIYGLEIPKHIQSEFGVDVSNHFYG